MAELKNWSYLGAMGRNDWFWVIGFFVLFLMNVVGGWFVPVRGFALLNYLMAGVMLACLINQFMWAAQRRLITELFRLVDQVAQESDELDDLQSRIERLPVYPNSRLH